MRSTRWIQKQKLVYYWVGKIPLTSGRGDHLTRPRISDIFKREFCKGIHVKASVGQSPDYLLGGGGMKGHCTNKLQHVLSWLFRTDRQKIVFFQAKHKYYTNKHLKHKIKKNSKISEPHPENLKCEVNIAGSGLEEDGSFGYESSFFPPWANSKIRVYKRGGFTPTMKIGQTKRNYFRGRNPP